MSEAVAVAIISAVGSSGVLIALVQMFRPKSEEAPVTTGQADAAQAHESQQVVLASLEIIGDSLEGTKRDLTRERKARERLAREVDDLRRAREADGALIRALRDGLNAFVAWGNSIHANWEAYRHEAEPPPLPTIPEPPAPRNAGPSH